MANDIDELRALIRNQILSERGLDSVPLSEHEMEREIARRIERQLAQQDAAAFEGWQDWAEPDDPLDVVEYDDVDDGVAESDGYEFLFDDDLPY
jgi:hypothetical protein